MERNRSAPRDWIGTAQRDADVFGRSAGDGNSRIDRGNCGRILSGIGGQRIDGIGGGVGIWIGFDSGARDFQLELCDHVGCAGRCGVINWSVVSGARGGAIGSDDGAA
jgi:hypothetical protein